MSELTPAQIDALIAALLAVSQFPLERVRAILPNLRASGLTTPSRVVSLDLGELTVALAKAGYHRGLLTSMYAERLQALMAAIDTGVLDVLSEFIAAGDRESFESKLRQIHGVGPKVAATAWTELNG